MNDNWLAKIAKNRKKWESKHLEGIRNSVDARVDITGTLDKIQDMVLDDEKEEYHLQRS